MSIPERFARIARHKFNEFKERLEELDADSAEFAEAERKVQQARGRADARHELDDALTQPPKDAGDSASAIPMPAAPRPRTPDEIARGSRPAAPAYAPPPAAPPMSGSGEADPLVYHYRLLGVEPGADFSEVQSAYNKFAARTDPSRFPADSQEAKEAQQIRTRLDASYKALRDALDPTARRFDLLEFDALPAQNSTGAAEGTAN